METKNADLSSLRIDRSKSELKNPEGNKIYKIIAGLVVLAIIIFVVIKVWGSLMNPPLEVEMTTAVMQSPHKQTLF